MESSTGHPEDEVVAAHVPPLSEGHDGLDDATSNDEPTDEPTDEDLDDLDDDELAASSPLSRALGLPMLVLAVLVGVGSLGDWFTATFQSSTGSVTVAQQGIEHWRGGGWVTLVLAAIALIVVLCDLVQPSLVLRPIAMTLFVGAIVVVAYLPVQYLWFASPQTPYGIGWGAWLCLGAGVLGAGIGLVWTRQSLRQLHLT